MSDSRSGRCRRPACSPVERAELVPVDVLDAAIARAEPGNRRSTRWSRSYREARAGPRGSRRGAGAGRAPLEGVRYWSRTIDTAAAHDAGLDDVRRRVRRRTPSGRPDPRAGGSWLAKTARTSSPGRHHRPAPLRPHPQPLVARRTPGGAAGARPPRWRRVRRCPGHRHGRLDPDPAAFLWRRRAQATFGAVPTGGVAALAPCWTRRADARTPAACGCWGRRSSYPCSRAVSSPPPLTQGRPAHRPRVRGRTPPPVRACPAAADALRRRCARGQLAAPAPAPYHPGRTVRPRTAHPSPARLWPAAVGGDGATSGPGWSCHRADPDDYVAARRARRRARRLASGSPTWISCSPPVTAVGPCASGRDPAYASRPWTYNPRRGLAGCRTGPARRFDPDGLPVGVQLTAAPGGKTHLLELATRLVRYLAARTLATRPTPTPHDTDQERVMRTSQVPPHHDERRRRAAGLDFHVGPSASG